MRALLAAVLLLAPVAAAAQTRTFSCIGAEALEDDVFAVPFAPGSPRLGPAGRTALAAAAARAEAEPERNLCVLGHADRRAGAESSTRLAAERARAVAMDLSAQRGIERDRIRAEARVGAYSGRVDEPSARAVTIVLMPSLR